MKLEEKAKDLQKENLLLAADNLRLRKALEEIKEGCKIGLWFHLIDKIATEALEEKHG